MRILFLVNHDVVIYNFRRELVERLIDNGHEVVISSPYGERIELLKKMGCKYIESHIDRHGKNPIQELKLLAYYKILIATTKPDIIFSYTIKPNIYGALAARLNRVPIVINITGLGTAVEGKGALQSAIVLLYKLAFKKVQTVFVQNEENKQYFIDSNISKNKLKLLPGSGVNLEHFHILDYPNSENKIEFVFISRIMKEKGIDHYLEMARYIYEKYPNTHFHICGFCEEEYKDTLKKYQDAGVITYHGMVMDIREILSFTHCTIHPTYYPEGLSNVLLESAASGRPIITTDWSGCREVVEDGVNGYEITQKNTQTLIKAVEKFLMLTNEERKAMGLAGRKKVEQEFDRQIVVDAYLRELMNEQ
jgi:galacturonosyltransferase